MYCLTNMCHVCLEKKDKSLINITSSSENKDIIRIISYLPFNLDWLKTKQIILICKECCLRLRGTYNFLAMCLKNSALMQDYVYKLSTASISTTNDEAELRVDLNNIQDDINETKLENEVLYTFEDEPIIEETVEFVNIDDAFVEEEDRWKREEVDGKEESTMDTSVTENNDNETDSEIFVNSNTQDTANIFIKKSIFCKYCKQFVYSEEFDGHIKQHENERLCCEYCGEMIFELNTFIHHSRMHRRNKCRLCSMQFDNRVSLREHLIVHTGIRRNQCKYCNRKFARPASLINHLVTRTCQKRKTKK